MASVRCTDVQARPTAFLDFTSVTLEELQALVPPFAAAFQAHMAVGRLDGTPRAARQFTLDKTCPFATPEDRLFFILVYLKTSALQVVHGRLFGRGPSTANPWIPVLLPALLAALRALGDAPTRSLTDLAQRRGVSAADAATVGTPLAEEPAPVDAVPAVASASPLVPMTAPNDVLSAPKTLRNRPHVRAARNRTIREKNVLLVNALLLILCLSDTSGGRPHEKPSADTTPSPLPAGSRLLQDLRVEPQVTRTAPPQTRTSAINTSGSSASRFRCINGVHDPGRRESVSL